MATKNGHLARRPSINSMICSRRFSLRHLGLAITALSIALAIYTSLSHRRQAALARLRLQGAVLSFEPPSIYDYLIRGGYPTINGVALSDIDFGSFSGD